MRPNAVVGVLPQPDHDLRFIRSVADLLPQAFNAQLAVEALAITVLPRRAWRNIIDVRAGHTVAAYLVGNILSNCFSREGKGAGVRTEVARLLAEAAARCSVLAHEVLGNEAVLAASPNWSSALYHALMSYRWDLDEMFTWPLQRIAFLVRKLPGKTAAAAGLRARSEPILASPP